MSSRNFKQAYDRFLLQVLTQIAERTREVSTSTKHSRTARAVVPVARRIKLRRVPLKTYQQFFDQQPVVKDDGAGSAGQCQLLVGEIRVGERSQTRRNSAPEELVAIHPWPLAPLPG